MTKTTIRNIIFNVKRSYIFKVKLEVINPNNLELVEAIDLNINLIYILYNKYKVKFVMEKLYIITSEIMVLK